MAAGLGFKTFTTGEVLTAADVNGYLMQGILVFANAAARSSAITSPQEGQYSFLKDTNALEYYDGAAWVGAPVGDITAVNAGTGITGGGASGSVTITNDMATTITASGDIVVGTGSGTYDNLPIGTTGQVLTADTTVSPYKVKWASASGGGANWSLLNSGGTALTGAQTITVSGISSKDKVLVVIDSGSSAIAQSYITLRINSDSGGNYSQYGINFDNDAIIPGKYTGTSTVLGRCSDQAASFIHGAVEISGCNSSGVKILNFNALGSKSGGSTQQGYSAYGIWNNSATVTSISVISDTGNWDAGTVYVYTSA